jgi:glycerophosphoryl diester phosphodiesterase
MLIYAHRGWSSRYPENTLRAFAEAISLGVDGIELDVQLSADGVPVVIHDRELSRTTDGNGHVDEATLAVLQSLNAGEGERIPTLHQVLELVEDTVHLDIEIKAPDAGSAVLSELRGFPQVRWAISSFDWHMLRQLRQADDSIELWPLAAECDAALLSVAAELKSPVVALDNAVFTESSTKTLRDARLQTFVWTVNDAAEAQRVEALGGYALCTDDPSLFIGE